MINPNHISKIVRNTLMEMGVYDHAMETLIKGTFLMESDLTNLMSDGGDKHGLMMMRNDQIIDVVREYVRYKLKLKQDFWEVMGFDLDTDCDEMLISESETNIKLMVGITYAFYDSFNNDIRDIDLTEIARIYVSNFDNHRTKTIDDFVTRYKQIFMER